MLSGERDASVDLAETALRLAIEQDERANAAYARHLLAEIRAIDGDVETAQRLYDEALEHAEDIGMTPLAARCHAGIARVLRTMSRADAAGRASRASAQDVQGHGHALLAGAPGDRDRRDRVATRDEAENAFAALRSKA